MSIIRDYFLQQANSLDAEYKGSLVPGHHGDTGANREDIVKKWLTAHIPRNVSAEIGGKILDSTGYLSEQIDLAIYDSAMPHFGIYPKSYFFAEGVNTVIQIKSILTSSELKSAVENLQSVKKCKRNFGGSIFIGDPNPQITTGIFAFDTDYSSSQAIVDALKRLETEGLTPVDFIFVNKKAYIAYNPGTWAALDEQGKEAAKLPSGYLIIDNGKDCIWRLVITIASESRKIIASTPDFQKYFLGGVLPPSTPQ
jgi:hypothetical protein